MECIDQGAFAGTLFIDFRKPFDVVVALHQPANPRGEGATQHHCLNPPLRRSQGFQSVFLRLA